MICSWFELV